MKERFRRGVEYLRDMLTDDKRRMSFQYAWVYILLAVISAFMTVVNVLTGKNILMCSTLAFAAVCLIDFAISRTGEKGVRLSSALLIVELIALFTFFVVSGEPEGFAAIWACLLPACAMVLYGRRRGVVMSLVMFAILAFFLWIPAGQRLCLFDYTASFRLRFPFLYFASFLLALFLELVREITQTELVKARQKYEHLCYFDQLTGLGSRVSYEKCLEQYDEKSLCCLMMDLDLFKEVNDSCGHAAGDEILRQTGALLIETIGGTWTVLRWGGEEFLAITDRVETPEEDACNVCEAFRSKVFRLPDGSEKRLTISVGAVRSNGNETADALVNRADACLYRAKAAGRGCYIVE